MDGSVFGIIVGDIVSTSYGAGPYVVRSITRPHYTERFPGVLIVRTWLVISLIGLLRDRPADKQGYILNSIRREGDRWFTDMNDEIFVTKGKSNKTRIFQLSMFELPGEAEMPYLFIDGVDYSQDVYRCREHGDYNGTPPAIHMYPTCPRCGRWPEYVVRLMEPRDPARPQASSCQVHLGFKTIPGAD